MASDTTTPLTHDQWRLPPENHRGPAADLRSTTTHGPDIQVQDRDPQLASDIANALANGYHSLEALGPGLSPAMLVDLARPETRPVGPNIYLNSFIGGLLGVVLGSVTAVVVWLILRRAGRSATRIPTPPSAPAA